MPPAPEEPRSALARALADARVGAVELQGRFRFRMAGEPGAGEAEAAQIVPRVLAAADEAFARYRAETDAAQDDWCAWFRLALAYDAAGDRRRARAAMRHAAQLHAEARLDQPQVLVERATEHRETLVVGGLEIELPLCGSRAAPGVRHGRAPLDRAWAPPERPSRTST